MKKWKILLFFIPLVALMSSTCSGEQLNIAGGSLTKFNIEMLAAYKDQGGYQLKTSLQNEVISIEFCSDNVCDEFTLPVTSSLNIAYDFLYLFEFSIPSDSILERKWKSRTDVVKYVSRLMGRYRLLANCNSKDDEKVQRICVMRYLITSQRIGINIVRYDEGERIASPTSLDEFLAK